RHARSRRRAVAHGRTHLRNHPAPAVRLLVCLARRHRSHAGGQFPRLRKSRSRAMKPWAIAMGLLAACANAHAETKVWQPSAGHVQVAIWPGTPPDAQPMPGSEHVKTGTKLIGGKPITGVTNVSRPTMTFYAPKGKNTG